MNVPYNELMAWHNKLKPIYEYPTFKHEYHIILSEITPEMRILDIGCGRGRIYNELLLANAHKGEYIGLDDDPSLATNFKLHKTVHDIVEAYPVRYFDVMLMLNVIEHLTLEEFYDMFYRLNPLVDDSVIIMTPNTQCPDYWFADPQHKTFYKYDFLYGFLKFFDFERIDIWRGKGWYPMKPPHIQKKQRELCIALGLDWYGNILIVGERSNE